MKFLTSCVALLLFVLAGCTAAQQRGMAGDTYVSTSRPAFSAAAKQLPLLAAGFGRASLSESGVLGGLNVDAWIAVYGKGDGNGPLAIVAQGELDDPWNWNNALYHPFAIHEGADMLNGLGVETCTYMVSESRDAFLPFMQPQAASAKKDEDKPVRRWIARAFACRTDFNKGKIILEYREPLPEGFTSLTSVPYGMSDVIPAFEERARQAFEINMSPAKPANIRQEYLSGLNWQYLDERFWGTVFLNDYSIRK
ncbi:MAG TPA: DUF4851 domain-containing protein [Candidatus Desulfovibrio gallistercoris]|uniref:DUF4851 domain-containing protein n=1 Tax=uncultured Desulfovibrio sp. TaxID=167968 RepID=UPI001F928DF4|nr:DUF4851 domain-containing protein [uncultured Desulfovibrio sp.]HJA76939.1 DUF4851 domain-containing protein [Candidatus Desulfovibrio gallistercoris]